MYFSVITLPLLALAGLTTAALNTTQSFRLVSQVKGGQCTSKARFGGLHLTGYHSGAGLNDAVLVAGAGVPASFNASAPPATLTNGKPYYNITFDLGNTFPYSIGLAPHNTYEQWYGLTIDAGTPSQSYYGFFANETGLQVALQPTGPAGQDPFGGWWACDWARGVPQLFLKLQYYNTTVPANCAEITLGLEYF